MKCSLISLLVLPRITIDVVAARMKVLLKGHYPLILRFNSFLPKEHEIKLGREPSPEIVRLVENIRVNNVLNYHMWLLFIY